MSYTPHVLVAFGGSWIADPAEVWECTVRLSADGGGGVTIDPDAYLDYIAVSLPIWFANSDNQMCASALLKFVKANHIGADGLYVDKTTTHVHDFTPGVAGGVGPIGPQFCSRVFTWETAVARGPGHRGRIYPPNATVAVSGSAFRCSVGSRDDAAHAGAGLLALLKNAAGPNGTKGTPVVASNIGGAIHPITGCSADDIFDVQRRRKNRIKGTRSATVGFA